MQDRIPTPGQEGRVLITPENGSPAYHAKVEMADNPSQAGTPLNKATLLKDATAALYGLGTDAVPDDVLAYVGRYNQHWWKRVPEVTVAETDEKQRNIAVTTTTGDIYYVGVIYSDKVSKTSTGALKLVDYSELKISYSENFDVSALNGKYFKIKVISGSGTTSDINTGNIFKGKSDITKTSSGSTSYSCSIICTVCSLGQGTPEYVRSSDRSAYPDSGTQDGYEYEYLGIPFDNAVGAPKIETGSYVGTGTYGVNSPTKLTFETSPTVVFIYREYAGGPVQIPHFWGNEVMGVFVSTTIKKLVVSTENNTISWWGGSSGEQLNEAGAKYYYAALYKHR